MKRVRECVGGNVPALGGSGDRQGGLFVERRQALEEGHENVLIGVGGGDLRIEVGGFGLIAEQKGVGANAGFDGSLAFRAAGDGEENDAGERKEGDEGERKRRPARHGSERSR